MFSSLHFITKQCTRVLKYVFHKGVIVFYILFFEIIICYVFFLWWNCHSFLAGKREKLLVLIFIGIEYSTMSYFNDPKETRCKYIWKKSKAYYIFGKPRYSSVKKRCLVMVRVSRPSFFMCNEKKNAVSNPFSVKYWFLDTSITNLALLMSSQWGCISANKFHFNQEFAGRGPIIFYFFDDRNFREDINTRSYFIYQVP